MTGRTADYFLLEPTSAAIGKKRDPFPLVGVSVINPRIPFPPQRPRLLVGTECGAVDVSGHFCSPSSPRGSTNTSVGTPNRCAINAAISAPGIATPCSIAS